MIMHVFGLAHFDAHILPLLVNTGERHKQTTHIVATITQTMTRFLWTFPSSFRNQFPDANTAFPPGCHGQNVPFSSSQVCVCLCKFLYKLARTCFRITPFMYSVAVDVVPFMLSRKREKQRPSTATLTENVSGVVLNSKFWKTEAHMIDPLTCLVCLRLVLQLVK